MASQQRSRRGQQRFEGPDLEALLETVRKEVGIDAHIVAANRIRKGGVGGFFAREGYEVIVDAPEGGTQQEQPEPPPRTRVPTSVLDLAEEINATERSVIDISEPERLSTESEDFGSMLARLSLELDGEELDRNQGDTRIDVDPAPPRAATATLPLTEDAPVSPRAHYRRVTPPAPAPEARPPVAPTRPPAAPKSRPAEPMPEFLPAPDERLAALGLPPELVPSVAAASDVRTALVQRLAQLPPPPMLPRAAGVVVAVVGIGTAPIALARRLADEMEVASDNIVLATPEPVSELSHPDEAAVFRRGLRRREEPTIVACSTGPGRAQLGWAHRMLDKLEPTVTWAVVESSCKAEDIGHRVGLLGGVDVLALTGLADTMSPAAVLSLGIPVGRIGATPATPAAWADLLIERLER